MVKAINRDRYQFISSMSHTTIGDLKERFGWRYESLSINEVISIMQIREKNGTHPVNAAFS
jgi:hypothetical protein